MKTIIYKIQNPVNQIYVGSTTSNLTQRKAEHNYRSKNNGKGLIYDSLRKYGFENHYFSIITEVLIDKNKELEHFIIEEFEPELNLVKHYNATAKNKIWINNGKIEFQIYLIDFEKHKEEYKKGRLKNPFKKTI